MCVNAWQASGHLTFSPTQFSKSVCPSNSKFISDAWHISRSWYYMRPSLCYCKSLMHPSMINMTTAGHCLSAIFVTVIVVFIILYQKLFYFTFTINLTTKISQGRWVVRCDWHVHGPKEEALYRCLESKQYNCKKVDLRISQYNSTKYSKQHNPRQKN